MAAQQRFKNKEAEVDLSPPLLLLLVQHVIHHAVCMAYAYSFSLVLGFIHIMTHRILLVKVGISLYKIYYPSTFFWGGGVGHPWQ